MAFVYSLPQRQATGVVFPGKNPLGNTVMRGIRYVNEPGRPTSTYFPSTVRRILLRGVVTRPLALGPDDAHVSLGGDPD